MLGRSSLLLPTTESLSGAQCICIFFLVILCTVNYKNVFRIFQFIKKALQVVGGLVERVIIDSIFMNGAHGDSLFRFRSPISD